MPDLENIPWAIVEIGLYSRAVAYNNSIQRIGFEVTDKAYYLMRQLPLGSRSQSIRVPLFQVSVESLGFKIGKLPEIYAKAAERGYTLCPAEAGPAACLAWPDHPMDSWANIAMPAIDGPEGDPSMFRLGREGGRPYLDACGCSPTGFWTAAQILIFTRG